jgi:hypothetical protein
MENLPKEDYVPNNAIMFGIKDADHLKHIAGQLKDFVENQKLAVELTKGKKFVQVEGWQFAGALIGVTAKAGNIQNLSKYEDVTWKWKEKKWHPNGTFKGIEEVEHKAPGTYRYQAEAILIDQKTGKEVGSGFGLCTSAETSKHRYEEYAIIGMAQTRAVSRAYRNGLAFLIKAAGYEVTPYEEVEGVQKNEDQSIVKEQEIPDDIRKHINEATDYNALSIWANEQKDYWQNMTFTGLVREKLKTLSSDGQG